MKELAGKVAVVVGASRGLGRGITEAFVGAGAEVVAVARDVSPLIDLAAESEHLDLVAADAADPAVAGQVLRERRADIVALIAGATPVLRPLQEHTWETFSANWNTDVRMAFHWLREALVIPLRPGSRIIVMSSGAALAGSPLSGGYAGAKATQRFIAGYAAQESLRGGLGITVTAVLPKLTPATELGRPAVAAYAARAGLSEEQYVEQMGPLVTPQIAGIAFVQLAAGMSSADGSAYVLTGDGLQAIPAQQSGSTVAARA
jgi:NAD(P)-dependent dehydrogenase (short-subunit alcohol dehydrogenase family)